MSDFATTIVVRAAVETTAVMAATTDDRDTARSAE